MKTILNKFKQNTFFITTLWILIISLLVKLLGLINKIFITRFLGPSGMSLYSLGIPTILLFINFSAFSLNTTLTKLIPEAIVSKEYSPKKLVLKSLKLALIISIISITFLLLLLYPLLNNWLKEKNLFFPILCSIPLFPLTGISDVLKGYLNGIKKMKHSSTANLLEQISRIIFSFTLLYFTKHLGIIISTCICFFSLSIGELISIIYCLFKLRKYPPINYPNTKNEIRKILSFSIPTTCSRLIGSFIFFLEPIIYTNVLLNNNIPQELIQNEYMIVNTYTIPLLTLGSVISYAISSSILPNLSEAFALNNQNRINYYIKKAISFIFILTLIISTTLYFYNNEIMNLLYKVTLGSNQVKKFAYIFILYYISIILTSIIQSMGKTKQLFFISLILNILKITILFITSNKSIWNINSLINTTVLIVILDFIIYLLFVLKYIKLKFDLKEILIYLLITILTISLFNLFNYFNINYILTIFIISIIVLYFSFSTNIISISSLIKRKGSSTIH